MADDSRYRSIIRFPEFLLHALKLFVLKGASARPGEQSQVKMKDDALLTEFGTHLPENADRDDAVAFIVFLLKTRALFDQFVVKLQVHDDPKLAQHRISHLVATGKSDKDYRREPREQTRLLGMLEGMLNVSTETEHWLTPFLGFLHATPRPDFGQAYAWLLKLDRRLAVTRLTRDIPLQRVADEAVTDPRTVDQATHVSPEQFEGVLHKGTGTERYWFFRLDYLLWQSWYQHTSSRPGPGGDVADPAYEAVSLIAAQDTEKDRAWHAAFRNFQFRQNRSVEHVHPRNPDQPGQQWDTDELDRFGNLALITVESNSSLSNQLPLKKRADVIYRLRKYGILESLKLGWIYSLIGEEQSPDRNWSAQVSAHETACLRVLARSLCTPPETEQH